MPAITASQFENKELQVVRVQPHLQEVLRAIKGTSFFGRLEVLLKHQKDLPTTDHAYSDLPCP